MAVAQARLLLYLHSSQQPFGAQVLSESHDEIANSDVPRSIQAIADKFQSLSDAKERYKLLLKYAKSLPAMNASDKISTNRVMGCTSEVWMTAKLDKNNRVQFNGDSNSELTRGLCALLVESMSGLTPQDVLQVWSLPYFNQSCHICSGILWS